MIGFIGLGIMGLPMARIILCSDQQLVVHSRSQESVTPLPSGGARTATSAAVPACSVAAANLEELLAEGGGDLDHSAIFTVLERAARRHLDGDPTL